jgi:hypothetical protein
MKNKDFEVVLYSKQSPQTVFEAVQDVRTWWHGYYGEKISGRTQKLNDEFTFTAAEGAHVSSHKLTEVVEAKRIVWLTTDSRLSFLDKKDEWVGTRIIFEISEADKKTKLVFTHQGLTKQSECYKDCAPAWEQYLRNKLLPLIEGKLKTNV